MVELKAQSINQESLRFKINQDVEISLPSFIEPDANVYGALSLQTWVGFSVDPFAPSVFIEFPAGVDEDDARSIPIGTDALFLVPKSSTTAELIRCIFSTTPPSMFLPNDQGEDGGNIWTAYLVRESQPRFILRNLSPQLILELLCFANSSVVDPRYIQTNSQPIIRLEPLAEWPFDWRVGYGLSLVNGIWVKRLKATASSTPFSTVEKFFAQTTIGEHIVCRFITRENEQDVGKVLIPFKKEDQKTFKSSWSLPLSCAPGTHSFVKNLNMLQTSIQSSGVIVLCFRESSSGIITENSDDVAVSSNFYVKHANIH